MSEIDEPRRSYGCADKAGHRESWRVAVREANYSAFNGYHRTPSAYSEVRCPLCPAVWRTKAGYVATLPDWNGADHG
jgi:hypothetical protein